jgi:hypothetical protein
LGYRKENSKREIYTCKCLKKSERSQVHNLMMHLKALKKQKETMSEAGRWKERIMTRVQV